MTAPVYSIVVPLEGRPVLVVGGGSEALSKVRGLLDAGASVTVVAPDAVEEIQGLAGRAALTWRRRPFAAADDLDRARLVLSATGDDEIDRRVAREARARGIWVNAADIPDACDFFLPAVVRRGPLRVAVSTSGLVAGFAGRLRRELEAILPVGLGDYVELLGAARREVLARFAGDPRRRRLIGALLDDEDARALATAGDRVGAEVALRRALDAAAGDHGDD